MYNEEIQEEACGIIISLGLPMGRLLEITESIIPNAIVGTNDDGDFWYGDLHMAEDTSLMSDVANKLGKTLRVSDESGTRMIIAAK